MRRGPAALTTATALVAVVSLLVAAGAAAATTVTLRIEGSQKTLFEGPVATEGREVDGGDGTGLHPCWGGLGATPGPTATTALADGAGSVGLPWRGNWNPDFYDFFVESIGSDSSMPPEGYWGLFVNGTSAGGGCTTKLKTGDEVLWAYGAVFKPNVLKLSGPSTAAVGEPFTVSVTAAGKPAAGATVGGATTNAAGQATIVSGRPARLLLKAERSDAVRSNGLEVCVGAEVGCQEQGAAATTTTAAGTPTIGKIEPGEVFAKGAGPRILRGETRGQPRVSLRLTTRRDGSCLSWSAPAAGMEGGACGTPAEFSAAVAGGAWSAQIGRLRPGKYTLQAAAPGGAAARLSFRILPRRATMGSLLRRGLRYLRAAQRSNGGLGVSPSVRASLGMTGWATMVLGRARPSTAAAAATRYIGRHLTASDPIADQVRSAFAVAAAGANPELSTLLCRRLARRHGAGGSYGRDVNSTALAVLALSASHCDRGVANRAARWLRGRRNPDGGFGYRAGLPSDVDTTGLATWALAAAPRTRSAAKAGIAYLRGAQNLDGGFGSAPGSESDSQSTGLALAGLRAAGVPPAAVRTEDGIDPLDYLATVQRGPGAIDYSRQGRQTPVWTTSQALLGLGRGPFLPAR